MAALRRVSSLSKATKLGSIQLEFSWDEPLAILHCVVISGKDLLPCDLNGLSDPFVVVEIRNASAGLKHGTVKSPVKYNNLNPTFMFDVAFSTKDYTEPALWRLHIELWYGVQGEGWFYAYHKHYQA
jgi:hypothetical protein